MKLLKMLIINALLLQILFSGCTDQRDLHTKASPMLMVENDWVPARIAFNDGATVMFYSTKSTKFMMSNPISDLIYLPKNKYNVLVFNGYMYSDQQSHLDNICYRNTGDFDTFEAVITEMKKNFKFRPKEGEIIVNNPDTLAVHSIVDKFIEELPSYEIKFENGRGNYPNAKDYVSDTINTSPCRVTHTCRVVVHVINAKQLNGLGIVKGSLRGFAGSVFLARRMPSHSNITHQFNLNHLKFDAGSTMDGTIYALFSTFGPPLDLPDRKYELQIDVRYPSGREQQFLFDVTPQLSLQIDKMNIYRNNNVPIMPEIVINAEIKLDIEEGDWDVGVNDWGDDIIITIPI